MQQPFADLIASGEKRWDVRTVRVQLPRRPFYLLATLHPHRIAPDYPADRLGCIVAIARSRGVVGPFDLDEMTKHRDEHLIDRDTLDAYSRGRRLYGMVLADVSPVDPPVPYRGKQGAVHVITNVESCSHRHQSRVTTHEVGSGHFFGQRPNTSAGSKTCSVMVAESTRSIRCISASDSSKQ